QVMLCVARVAADAPDLPREIEIAVVPFADEGEAGDPRAAAAVFQAVAGFSPDVIHVHNAFDWEVFDALHARWPLVWHCHDYRTNCPNGDRRFPHWGLPCTSPMGAACVVHSVVSGCVAGPRPKTLRELRMRRRLFSSVKQADLIAAPSYCVAKILEINGVDRRRIAILPSFTPFADLAEAPPYPTSPALLFAARLVQQKGIDDVLWLAGELQDKGVQARVIVAGAGPGLETFVDAAKSHPALDVRGMLHSDALSAAYAESSAVLITPNWLDPFPLIGLDAMAHARPVIAYDIGGIGELVESGVDGVMVPAGDRAQLAAAVGQILTDPRRSADMGRRGREKVRAKYRLRNSLDAAIRAYSDAIQLHAPSASHRSPLQGK
ncbi:MAG TPA: glycosyltransferase family 4 protein, partial [Candidatus Eremiobacteraceae bacterium]|nr:glycosyltransferase family 4 protein [Candidatus Eremiobacteraceae bacterium]